MTKDQLRWAIESLEKEAEFWERQHSNLHECNYFYRGCSETARKAVAMLSVFLPSEKVKDANGSQSISVVA